MPVVAADASWKAVITLSWEFRRPLFTLGENLAHFSDSRKKTAQGSGLQHLMLFFLMERAFEYVTVGLIGLDGSKLRDRMLARIHPNSYDLAVFG